MAGVWYLMSTMTSSIAPDGAGPGSSRWTSLVGVGDVAVLGETDSTERGEGEPPAHAVNPEVGARTAMRKQAPIPPERNLQRWAPIEAS